MNALRFCLIIFLSLTSFLSFGLPENQKDTYVLIQTDLGDIKIKLYDETPAHKKNFIKLAKEGFYDGTLFHRIIKNFMIQGGDPNSKDAKPGVSLGQGGPGYTIEAEFNKNFYHKKGALAAARQGDNVNPEQRSSGSQFYVVEGKKYTKEELASFANRINQQRISGYLSKYLKDPKNADLMKKVKQLQQDKKFVELNELSTELNQKAEDAVGKFEFTEAQITDYTTIGGTPFLDGSYTVFGEVVEGNGCD